MTLTSVNEYKGISKDPVHPQNRSTCFWTLRHAENKRTLLVSLLLTPSALSFLVDALD
jgi:hypothetical protein